MIPNNTGVYNVRKSEKQDRRTRYTRQTIKDTFLELLKQKSFTKITVTEVCKMLKSTVALFIFITTISMMYYQIFLMI